MLHHWTFGGPNLWWWLLLTGQPSSKASLTQDLITDNRADLACIMKVWMSMEDMFLLGSMWATAWMWRGDSQSRGRGVFHHPSFLKCCPTDVCTVGLYALVGVVAPISVSFWGRLLREWLVFSFRRSWMKWIIWTLFRIWVLPGVQCWNDIGCACLWPLDCSGKNRNLSRTQLSACF